MIRKYRIILSLLFLAFIVRLYNISTPLLDWHSFRQVDTASVTQEFVVNGVDILLPRYHDLSNIQSGKENPEGWRMVELPLPQALVAVIVRAVPAFSLVVVSRLLTVFFSLITLISIYYLVRDISGEIPARLSALVFAILPYSVFYSRVIMPDPIMVGLSSAAILCFWLWTKKYHSRYLLLTGLLMALSLLIKPFSLFLAPVFLAIAITEFAKIGWKKIIQAVVIGGISLLPLLWWRNWILQFPAGIPASDWLYNGPINEVPPRLRPVWFRWLWYERLTKLMLGYVGVTFLFSNFISFFSKITKRTRNELLIYGSWWLAVILFFIVIARGNVQHDYYQIFMLPILSISVGRGMYLLFNLLKKYNKRIAYLSVSSIFIAMLFLAWQQVKGYYVINHWEYVEAGARVQALTNPEDLVIAPAFGDTMFLFQTRRRGWPIGFEIDKKIAAGAQYYITTSYDDEARELEKEYLTLEKTDKYLFLDLQKHL